MKHLGVRGNHWQWTLAANKLFLKLPYNIILSGQRPDALPLRLGTRKGCLFSRETQSDEARKRNRGITIGKEKSLYTDGTIVSTGKSKKAIQKY